MGVDEIDLVGRDAPPLEGHLHCPSRARTGLDRLDHVPAVRRGAIAHDLGVDPRATGLRVLEVLEEQRARALSQDEAVTRPVEWARDGLRPFAGARQAHAAHVREAGVGHLEQRGLG